MVYWRGLLVLAGDQTDNAVGQPQSNLWFGNIDELASWGKPAGWGAVWRDTEIKSSVASEPFLMTGFDKKTLHLTHSSNSPVTFDIQIDFLGDNTWHTYKSIRVTPKDYEAFVFPKGFSAHWVRLKANKACSATAQFFYN